MLIILLEVTAAEEVLVHPGAPRKYRIAEAKSGQAMIEFILGLVGIMFLLIGLLQVRELSWTSTQMSLDIRENIADQMTGSGSLQSGVLNYSEGHTRGADNRMYTSDDKMMTGSISSFLGNFMDHSGYSTPSSQGGLSTKEYLSDYNLHDPYMALDSVSANLAEPFDMLYQPGSDDIFVLPFISPLIGKGRIDIETEVWMPELGNLMGTP
ncbi:hypothetical protein P4E94_09725 [Pontiellaceae bacterium B12219]|nr:hypothetical protein [Pontiellaceae bacterium B12219]